jgi:hypothetical protein
MEEHAAAPIASSNDLNGASLSASNNTTVVDAKEESAKQRMVSVRELFSFVRTRKSRLCIAGSFVFAGISGASFPGKRCASLALNKYVYYPCYSYIGD